jgi:hypothetical protein
VRQLIDELDCADLSNDAKQKTIETLHAITGMLQSLREKKLLENETLRVQKGDGT